MEVETLTGSSSSSSSSKSDSSNSTSESDNENTSEVEQHQKIGKRQKGPKVPLDPVAQAQVYNQRYNNLMERINAINQDNEHLVSRILEVRSLCKTGLKHRSAIMKRLDKYGDNYKNIPVTISLDKDSTNITTSSLLSNPPVEGSTLRKTYDDSLLFLQSSKQSLLPQKYRKRLKREASVEESDQDDSKRTITEHDSDVPKRPHNAFFYYSQHKRPRMKKEFPNLNKKEIASILTARWSQMSEEEKRPFVLFEEAKRREYRAAMARYRERHPSQSC